MLPPSDPTSLARKLEDAITQPQLMKWLKGIAREPKPSTLRPIAEHYDIPIDALFDDDKAVNLICERFPEDAKRMRLSVSPEPQEGPAAGAQTTAQASDGLRDDERLLVALWRDISPPLRPDLSSEEVREKTMMALVLVKRGTAARGRSRQTLHSIGAKSTKTKAGRGTT